MTFPGPIVTLRVVAPLDKKGKPIWLLQNHRLHHHAKAPITRAWLQAAQTEAEPVAATHTYASPVGITLTPHRKGRPVDVDSIAPTAKACIDGIVKAGLMINDDPTWLTSVTYRQPVKSKTDYLEIIIKEQE